MINKLKEKLDQDTINYVIGEDINKKMIYAPTLCMNLNVMKIRRLGWHPEKDLYVEPSQEEENKGLFERIFSRISTFKLIMFGLGAIIIFVFIAIVYVFFFQT